MPEQLKKIPVVFFTTSAGNEPVREWLQELDKGDRQEIGSDLRTLQYGWPVGMPLCRSFGEGLWEQRSKLPGRRIARLIFAFDHGTLVVLHGFIKKTQKTPRADIDLALDRLKEMAS